MVCKIGTKYGFVGTLKSYPVGYVTINQNFSPIPQIYTPNPTILAK